MQEHQSFKEHELHPSIHIQGANEGCPTAKKSWGDRVQIEEKEASTMTTEFVLETGKTYVYSEIKSSDMGNMAGDIIVTSQGKNVEESIPVGNGVTIDGRAQLEQLKVNSDM
ncbi:hypothetical protein FRX31_024968 [Thalictrum thalictroides]|uniref:Uncharacterized protein n=1 Tax=Thalictrum thalictroides TaxID=46969 RepID=A0A7J6VMS2_THATH|nr:hypothetical protein FRX31_024968 [Thalictrum thalictroides]